MWLSGSDIDIGIDNGIGNGSGGRPLWFRLSGGKLRSGLCAVGEDWCCCCCCCDWCDNDNEDEEEDDDDDEEEEEELDDDDDDEEEEEEGEEEEEEGMNRWNRLGVARYTLDNISLDSFMSSAIWRLMVELRGPRSCCTAIPNVVVNHKKKTIHKINKYE